MVENEESRSSSSSLITELRLESKELKVSLKSWSLLSSSMLFSYVSSDLEMSSNDL